MNNNNTLDGVYDEAFLQLVEKRKTLPLLEQKYQKMANELNDMQKQNLRSTIRKRRDLEGELQKLKREIDFLKSKEPEQQIENQIQPFFLAKQRMEQSQKADCELDYFDENNDLRSSQQLEILANECRALILKYSSSSNKSNFQLINNNLCSNCKSVLLDAPYQSRRICKMCGLTSFYIDNTQALVGNNEDVEITSFQYKRLTHMKDFITRFQAKENFVVPDHVLKKIFLELVRHGYSKKDLIPPEGALLLKFVMKPLKFSKYYNHIPQIKMRLSGVPAPRCDPEQERFVLMFIAIQPAYDFLCPSDRHNFLNYAYCFFQFSTYLGYLEFLPHVILLKGDDKIKEHDAIYAQMSEMLGWDVICAFKTRNELLSNQNILLQSLKAKNTKLKTITPAVAAAAANEEDDDEDDD